MKINEITSPYEGIMKKHLLEDKEMKDKELHSDDAELQEVIEELRAQGHSDEEIETFFHEVIAEAEADMANPDKKKEEDEEAPKPIDLHEGLADAVINGEPAKVGEIFDAAIKARLAPAIDEYKAYLASTMLGGQPPEEEAEEEEAESEEDKAEVDDCDDEESEDAGKGSQ